VIADDSGLEVDALAVDGNLFARLCWRERDGTDQKSINYFASLREFRAQRWASCSISLRRGLARNAISSESSKELWKEVFRR